jgi:hypothetical protein
MARGFLLRVPRRAALRARRTDDPEVWMMLSRLGEEYTLAGGDD